MALILKSGGTWIVDQTSISVPYCGHFQKQQLVASGLWVQHVIDALDATLPTSIDSLLCQVINLLITGKVPAPLAPYLAGGNLTALMKLRSLDGMSGQLPWVKSSDVWQVNVLVH